MTLSEQYSQALDNLLSVLRMLKDSGQFIDGVPTEMLFTFAKSEINGLAQGFKTKDECKSCTLPLCCVAPPAIIPAQGIDGGLARPLKYVLKYRRQPCVWLRQTAEGFKCNLHETREKPFTCLAFLCTSRDELEKTISNAEKVIVNSGGK